MQYFVSYYLLFPPPSLFPFFWAGGGGGEGVSSPGRISFCNAGAVPRFSLFPPSLIPYRAAARDGSACWCHVDENETETETGNELNGWMGGVLG